MKPLTSTNGNTGFSNISTDISEDRKFHEVVALEEVTSDDDSSEATKFLGVAALEEVTSITEEPICCLEMQERNFVSQISTNQELSLVKAIGLDVRAACFYQPPPLGRCGFLRVYYRSAY